MNSWPAPDYASAASPDEYRPAGMGRRVGAWILDSLLSGLISAIAFVFGIVSGAVGINQQALDQLSAVPRGTPDPFATVSAPLLTVHTGPLIAAVVLLIAINAVYFAGSWLLIGGSPCQRLLGLRVANVEDGKNVSIDAAIIRWLLIGGIASTFSGILAVMILNWIATTPTNQWLVTGAYATTATTTSFGSAGAMANVVSGVSTLWQIALLISAGAGSMHRGIHDRLAGTIVLGRYTPAAVGWGGYEAPAQAWQGYPPQAPQGPGYPPQGPGYPPQGPGYQPQGPGYQPQGPGYPPQGPGYPPQAPQGPGAPLQPPQPWAGYEQPGLPPPPGNPNDQTR